MQPPSKTGEKPLKVTGSDKVHILNVLGGIEDGKPESWVREQFSSYTRKFLESVEKEKKKKLIVHYFWIDLQFLLVGI